MFRETKGISLMALLKACSVWSLVLFTASAAQAQITYYAVDPGGNTRLEADWDDETDGIDGITPLFSYGGNNETVDGLWHYDGDSLLAFSTTENAPDLRTIVRGLDPTHGYNIHVQYYAYNNSSTTAFYGVTAKLNGGSFQTYGGPSGATAVTLQSANLGYVQGVDQAWTSISRAHSAPYSSHNQRSYIKAIGIEDLGLAPELTPGVNPVFRPAQGQFMTYESRDLRGAREIYGYNPRYYPNVPTFNLDNTAFIRHGRNNGSVVHTPSWDSNEGIIQTVNEDGDWVEYSFHDAIKEKYPNWSGNFLSGYRTDERIIFDGDGDAYTLINVSRNVTGIPAPNLLLHSRDNARNWDVYELPGTEWTRLESPNGNSDRSNPPVIMGHSGHYGSDIRIFTPDKLTDGTLDIRSRVVASNSVNAPVPSPQPMLANATASFGSKVHTVYMGNQTNPSIPGSPQYIVTYDRDTDTLETPVLMGYSGVGGADIHNGPAIAVDSQGYLHVLFGTHHQPFQYTRSLTPNTSDAGWTTPVEIGQPYGGGGSYTYPNMLMDQDDTIHVFARNATVGYRFSLDYMRKTASGGWEDMGSIVRPTRANYNHWYHKVSIDEEGKIFLSYTYYANNLSIHADNPHHGDEIGDYRAKYPDEDISLYPGSREDFGSWNVQAHDPVVMVSDDGGDTWRLAVSSDFGANGNVPIVLYTGPSVLGDFNNNGTVEQEDLALVLAHWGAAIDDGEAPGLDWLNTDGVTASMIGQDELALVLQNWGNTAAVNLLAGNIADATGLTENEVLSLIPEPASAVLLAGGTLLLIRRQRREMPLAA